MNPNVKWKALFIVGVILLCAYGLIGMPNAPTSWENVKSNLALRIKLGLDLQGGTHLILQVQVAEAVGLYADGTVDRLGEELPKQNITFQEIRKLPDNRIEIRNVGGEGAGAFRDRIAELAPDWDYAPTTGEISGYMLTLKGAALNAIRQRTMQQSLETIDRRIDALGLTEPTIAEHGRGDWEILVQLPGEGDPTRAKAVIRAGGQLELRLVAKETLFTSQAEALGASGGILPAGTELVRAKPARPAPGETQVPGERWMLLERRPVVVGTDLRSANTSPSTKYPGFYDVLFNISTTAAQRFGPFTEQNIGKQLAIVLDKRIESSPVINGRIEDSGMIEGRFGQEEAKDLALILRAGALPASIKYLEERTIGPSLGADSIRQGVQASLASLVLVMIFMVIYYRLSGVNAVLALILNLIILMAALAWFGAVLTLPGIAGVILTIGMGVDSNVLVFERIREELRAGKATVSAVEAGFDRAFLTILDTHVTTVVSALFLFVFGTGPVRGFAVTLVIGLISNLFTAIYVSKTIFGWHLGRMPRQAELSI